MSEFLISAITKLRSPFNFHRCPSPLFTVRFRCPTLQNSQCQPCLRKYHRQFSSSQPKYISYVAGIGITLAKQLEKLCMLPFGMLTCICGLLWNWTKCWHLRKGDDFAKQQLNPLSVSEQRKCNAIATLGPSCVHTHAHTPEPVHTPFRIGALARLEELSVSNMHLLDLAHVFVLCDEE